MRIIHTSDWHLGKKLESISRFEEQKSVLEEICAHTDELQADLVLICGDLFDTYNPPAESIDLFYKTLKKLSADGSRAVIAIAGNHDSPDRIEAPDPLARECGIIFAGYPDTTVAPFQLNSGLEVIKSSQGFIELKLPEIEYSAGIIITPYANELRLRKSLGQNSSGGQLRDMLAQNWADTVCRHHGCAVNILCAHLLVSAGEDVPEEPDDEKPILQIGGAGLVYASNLAARINYSALGHLHRFQTVVDGSSPVVYCGSPIAYSMSEAYQDKFIAVTDIEPGKPARVEKIKLKSGKQLARKTFSSVAQAVNWLEQNTDKLVEITMETETYITAQDIKALTGAHSGIVNIIPSVKNIEAGYRGNIKPIDLSKNIEELFSDYFEFVKSRQPSDKIMGLFMEILNVEDENG